MLPCFINLTFDAYFIQIGTDKNENQIKKILTDSGNNVEKYKIGIKKFIGYDISNVQVVFIFDKETQLNKKKKIEEEEKRGNKGKKEFSCVKYCLENQILFYLFSVEDYILYSTSDMINFNKKIIFGKKATKQKSTYICRFKNVIGTLLNFEEISAIDALMNSDIYRNYEATMRHEDIGKAIKDFNLTYDKENIYIFQNTTNKIYFIKNNYYIMEYGKLKEIKNIKTDIYVNNIKYDEIIMIKKKKNIEERPIIKGLKRFKKK